MPSWPEKRTLIGSRVKRIDGPAKVTGAAKYPSDVQPEGWLYGMILRSKWPKARVTKIDLEKALKVPGIKAAVTARDGERTVRYYGEELAAVAGTTKQACLDALRVIEVEAKPLPFVVREEDAKEESSPRVWDDTPNLSKPGLNEKGDVDKAFGECATVVEGFYTTPVQLHHPLETHGNTVSWTDEGLTAWSSTQGISSVRDGFAGNLKLQHSQVRVISEYMGGGFGSKFGQGVEGSLAARLSHDAKAPVRIMLTRFDEALAVGNRPSSFQKIKLGATADGKLHAFELESYGTAGIGAGGSSEGGGGGAGFPAPYIYRVPNTRVRQSSVNVNAGSARAFRAPGHPTSSYGMESIMDELAVKMGVDPVELRLKNDPSEVRRKEYQLGAERFGWKEKYKKPGSSPGPIKTGVGCAGATWGGGGGGTQAEAQINPDGSIEIRCGTQDLGTGCRTLIAVIAAELLGLQPEQITVRIGDTQFPPSGGSGGSTTTASVSPAIYDVCTKALQELQTQTGIADARGANWTAACKKLGVNPLTVSGRWQQGLSSSGAGGVQFAEVEVDTETGFVKVKKITCIQDGGLIVNKLTAESQVNGGIIMGIGYALYEERIMDRLSGVVLNPNFETYKLPALADMPEFDVVLLDMPERGVIGIGEPVTIPTASAVANAVANALGVRVSSLPITPQRVLDALGKKAESVPAAAAKPQA
ncbi:MAG TPA: xanthine dehydrogenase family protein molybdopterin-binding subunit [Candidatus Binatia bacterium]|jgi:xanthine dehydrogenase YagR molybdenum-binding subunit|nr:xanthine dehydrogenase family protein molybdopterin-binding subunit [Candidatus Binatia bacterium]